MTLLHPEYFSKIPFRSSTLVDKFEQLDKSVEPHPNEADGITVALRTLNESARLEALLEDVRQQEFNGPVEIVVVDNESSDDTVDVAKSFGAKVLSLPRAEFTYPRSMNMATEAASHDTVFMTVGHAQLVSTKTLRAGVNAMSQPGVNVGGAYGHALPGYNASSVENLIAMGNLYYAKQRRVRKAGIGVMAATGVMFSKSLWGSLGRFDESFEQGGEDTEFAKRILETGKEIVDEPLLSPHHTHGLGFADTVKQWHSWTQLSRPSRWSKEKLQARRPDLKLED